MHKPQAGAPHMPVLGSRANEMQQHAACRAGAGRTSSQLLGRIWPCSGDLQHTSLARPHSGETTN